MDAFLGLMGTLGFIVGLIWLLRNKLLAKKAIKPAAILLIISFLMFSIAMAMSPAPGEPDLPAGSDLIEEGSFEGEEGALPDQDEELPEEGAKEEGEPGVGEAPAPAVPAAPAAVGQMVVHFIDVGQGDAILIQTPEQNILIDGGDRGSTVLNYLKARGVKSLDLVIGTHPHADHIGGLINVLQEIPVKEVMDPAVVHTTKTFEDYLRVIDEKDITFTEGRTGMTRDLGGGARLVVLHPTSPSSSHLNNASIVAQVIFGRVSFLFTGDAERAAESQMLNRGDNTSSTILKVGHHGSRTSTTRAFLQAVNPEAAVIMADRNNRYGHPHEETLAALAGAGVDIYRTDLHGTVIITTDGSTYRVNIDTPYRYSPAGGGAGSQEPPPPEEEKEKAPETEPESETKPEPEPVQSPAGTVNINTASLEELQEIVHIGPVRAEELISLRPFASLDELTRISGIGPARLQDIKDQGIAYVE